MNKLNARAFERFLSENDNNLYIIQSSDADFEGFVDEVRHTLPQADIHLIQGDKHPSKETFFERIVTTLQFPYYFGENWAAFNDCLHDLYRSGKPILLLVSRASQLLQSDDTDLRHLLEIVQQHHLDWSTASSESEADISEIDTSEINTPESDKGSAFHVLLQEDASRINTLKQRIEALGMSYSLFPEAQSP